MNTPENNRRLKVTSKLLGSVRELAELDVEEGCYRPEELTFVVSRADRPRAVKEMKAANPELSNRQLAKLVGADERTIRRDNAANAAPNAANAAPNGKKLPPDEDNSIPDITADSKKYLSRLLDFKETYLNGVRNWLVKAELDENTKAVLANALHSMANELALLAQEIVDQTTETDNG